MQKLLAELRGRERDGSDDRLDGGEAVGNSLGRAPLDSVGKERDGSDDRVDGGEAVGKQSCWHWPKTFHRNNTRSK